MKKHQPDPAHRVTTVKPNGGLPTSQEVAPPQLSTGEAMRLAVQALGDLQVDPDLAPAQLRELGDLYEQVAREQAAYDLKAEATKIAKKALESAQTLLLERVKAFTHPEPLPLFDAVQAEQDRATMLQSEVAHG